MLDTFDMAIEISRGKLLDYILENVQIDNLPIVPKFVFKTSGQAGAVQALVDGVDLTFGVGTDTATLTYHVYGAVMSTAAQSQVGFSDGQITIGLKLSSGTPFNATLQSIEFQTGQTSQLKDPTQFFQDVNGLLSGLIDTKKVWNLFPDTPDATATLLIGLAFSGQISCLDADTVVAAVGQGAIGNVTNFLQLEDFAIMLSAARVKGTLLFPAMLTLADPQDVADELGIPLADAQNLLANPTLSFINQLKPFLPAPFGSGSLKQSVSGVDLFYDFVDFTLNNGNISMTAKFHGEGFCAHIHDGEADEIITLSIVNQQVVSAFSPNPPVPTYSVEFDFWCGFGFIFLASNVALITGIVVTAILISVATSITVQENELTESPFSVPAFDQVTWNGVQVFTEGLVLRGSSSASAGYNTTLSRVDITSKLATENAQDSGPGTYHFPGSFSCPARDFQYEEFTQDVVVTLQVQPTQLLNPLKTIWTVHGQNITTGSGQISYTDLAHTATPPFNETALPNHQIVIDYAVNPWIIIYKGPSPLTTLQLTIPKSDYNFSLLVEVAVQDGDGHTYTSQVGLDIQTDIVQFGQDFQDFQKQCGLASKINISKIKTLPQGVLTGGEGLTVREVTNVVKEIATEVSPQQAVLVARSLGNVYGANSVIRAFSPTVEVRGELEG